MNPYLTIVMGFAAGILSGIIGIGGGLVIVPALVFLLGFSQRLAQGTSLAMLLLPIGILAVWTYYKEGFVDVKVALLLAVGFVFGGLLGAKFAVNLPDIALKKVFGTVLLLISIKMILGK